jgi:hypothetical protein
MTAQTSCRSISAARNSVAIASKAGAIARSGKRRVGKALAKAHEGVREVPGPSPNPATNLLIADIAVRSAGIVFRHAVERALLRARFKPEEAKEIVEGRTLGRSLITHTAARVAMRSVPGFLAVAGGLAAKAVVDRSLGRAKARRAGDKTLARKARTARDA